KLKYFLDESNIDINNLECLDIGSSTGGFCEVLLDAGAKSVFCIDVGSNQLHESLRTNPKVTLFENLDIRDFQTKQKFDLITCDVSFISVLKILDKIDELAKKEIIILFKPQFEVGANIKRDKFGVVKDEKAIIRAIDLFISNTVMKGWKLLEQKNSKLQGKDGNKEILFRFAK
ncbi:MAG: TlyA family RNA methyltransferase, partial [Campylobacterales bacterium]|nr:TlyA family RNA methyltransferase [Campylobacterales bacterium]